MSHAEFRGNFQKMESIFISCLYITNRSCKNTVTKRLLKPQIRKCRRFLLVAEYNICYNLFAYMADELTPADFPQGELLFYTSKDGKVKMEIRVECETIWMSQQLSEMQ